MYGLIPYSNMKSLGRFRRDMNDLFSDFLGNMELPTSRESMRFAPPVDIRETEEGIEISAEIPGLKPEEIEVSLNGDVLTLKGEKKFEHEDKKEGYHLVERSYGSFYRSFKLPFEVDREKLSAKHKDGVLKISLPKAEAVKPKLIEVNGE